jgi:hypothetical protein
MEKQETKENHNPLSKIAAVKPCAPLDSHEGGDHIPSLGR